MCAVQVDENRNVTGHRGREVNGVWFDREGDTIIVCAHPAGDLTKAPTFERTFSVSAFGDAVQALLTGG